MSNQSVKTSAEAASYMALWMAIHGGDPADGIVSKEMAKDIAAHIISTMSSYILSHSETKPGVANVEEGLAKFGAKHVDSPATKSNGGKLKPELYCVTAGHGSHLCFPSGGGHLLE